MKKLIAFIVFFLVIYGLRAQQFTDSTMASRMVVTRQMYDKQWGSQSAIYNGIQHYPYSSSIEGIAYFQTADWRKGTVVFEDVPYDNIFIKYDVVADQVIITPDNNGGLFIGLFGPRVKEFSFSGMKFVRFTKTNFGAGLPEGFYQELATGKVKAYAKTMKFIEEKVDISGISRKFFQKVRYYIFKEGKYHVIKNKKGLLSVLKEHKKEVQQYLGKLNVKYKFNPEQNITAAVNIYNQSN
jgi:hypothetical protein